MNYVVGKCINTLTIDYDKRVEQYTLFLYPSTYEEYQMNGRWYLECFSRWRKKKIFWPYANGLIMKMTSWSELEAHFECSIACS